MPNIVIDGPPVADLEKKRALVREVTDSVSKAFGLPKETIVIVLKENLPENVGVGGCLLVDRRKPPDPAR